MKKLSINFKALLTIVIILVFSACDSSFDEIKPAQSELKANIQANGDGNSGGEPDNNNPPK